VRLKRYYSRTLYRSFWFNAGLTAARVLGVRGARRLGRFGGAIYGWTHPQARAAVRANLALVCKAAANNGGVTRTFRNFGATLADYFQIGALSKTEARKLITVRLGFENIRAALAHGKGVLLVTIHTGLFELGGLLMEEFQLPLVVLSLPEPNPALNAWRAAYRHRWGAETLEVGRDQFVFVAIARELAAGKCVAMLVDRPHRGDDAILVDFPHGQVPFSTGPAWLSLLTGAPLVPVTVLATPDNKYTVDAQPPLYLQCRDGSQTAAVRESTVELAARFREIICQHPDQWYQFVPLLASR
jgi:lauroyl/myristoyl acyltransferase